MKIALISEHASPLALLGGVDAGGQNVHVAELARALGRLGAHVVVHTRRDDASLPRRVQYDERVWVDHVDAGRPRHIAKDQLLPFMPAFARELRAAWIAERPDAVHSHFWMSGLAALQARRGLGVPLAHTYHALGTVKRRHQGAADTSPAQRVPVERRLALESDCVIATTDDERHELIGMGADDGRITVIPCGVDLNRFTPSGPRARHASPAPPRRRGLRRVVVISRLVERKGIGNVIAAVRALPDVEVVIAGGPPCEQLAADAEACRFSSLAARIGVDDRVTLLGAVDRADVPRLIRSADVVACCPWYEPFGLVAIEAMACGVPVVASAVGGLAESVRDGETGVLVPPRSPERIAEAVRWMLADDRRRRAMGRAGAMRAQRYGWDRIAEETYAVLERLAAERPSIGRRTA